MENIHEVTTLSERGTLTLPANIRNSLGLHGKQQIIVETTSSGEIILRPAYTITVPIEYYTEERIKEFAEDEEDLGKILDRLERRKSSRKPPRQTPPLMRVFLDANILFSACKEGSNLPG